MAIGALTALSGFRSDKGDSLYWNDGLVFSNSIRVIHDNTQEEYEKMIRAAEDDADVFLQTTKMKAWNQSLENKYACIMVVKDKRLVFNGSNNRYDIRLSDLPPYTDEMDGNAEDLFLIREQPFLIRQTPIRFSDEKTGCVYLIAHANALLPLGRQVLTDLLLSAVIILAFTAIILVIWIYRGMFAQVNRLVKAAENIKDGNLDFTLKADGDDEMSVLVNTFESMRGRLQQDAMDKIEAENEHRQLISNIAHDLKTPLTSIRGYAEGILDGVADTPQKQEAYLRTINKKANEMNTLLNELTLYSKIDTNRIPYNFTRQRVNAFFKDCVEELHIDLDNEHVHLDYTTDLEDGIEFIIDPEQLMRVILNIIQNSVKYKSENARIQIRVLDVGDFVQVEIEDNGKGIEAKDLPYIFDRMYRGDASRNSGIPGSGIGLSVAKKIIEDHGGQIWATSKVAIGTVMYFVLRKYEEVQSGEDTDR